MDDDLMAVITLLKFLARAKRCKRCRGTGITVASAWCSCSIGADMQWQYDWPGGR